MQDRENSTPEGADESGLIKPEQESEHGDTQSSDSEQPEKVYDFYHQHFGVALAAGSQEIRNAEASGRAAYAARTEVADKISAPKSESWNALKSLIRYQTSSTPAPASQVSDTTSGDSFEAQWFGKHSEDLPGAVEQQEQEAVRLKWTPIVDNVPDAEIETEPDTHVPAAEIQTESETDAPPTASSEHSSAAEPALPPPKKFVGMPSRMVRRPQLKHQSPSVNSGETTLKLSSSDESTPGHSEPEDHSTPSHSDLEDDSTLKIVSADESTISRSAPEEAPSELEELMLTAPIAEEDDASESKAAEIRSKFGNMNAFAKLQQRTKEKVETKEEQSITGDIPEEVQDQVQSGNWETISVPESTKTEGATVMNQWCSTSTGDSHPKISLAELDSIPTPSVMKDLPQNKPFSLSTPKSATAMETTQPAPDSVQQTARASWLKAASEYSSSVIKAVTEQMKILSAKPKKVTPESPEFRTAEPPDSTKDNSST